MPHRHSSSTAPSRRPWFSTAAAALLALGGCVGAGGGSGGPMISYSSIEPIYNYQEASYAADGRDLEVVVLSNPFGEAGVSDDALGDAVVGAMQGQPGWMVTNFTTTPGESARPLYRVVWLIGVDAGTSLYRLCGPTSGINIAGYNVGAYTPSDAERAAPPKAGHQGDRRVLPARAHDDLPWRIDRRHHFARRSAFPRVHQDRDAPAVAPSRPVPPGSEPRFGHLSATLSPS